MIKDYSIVIPILFLLVAITVFIILIYTDRFGINNRILSIDNKLSNIDNQFLLNVSSENIENHSVVNIFGENNSIGSSFRTVWENSNTNDYAFPTSGLIMTVTNNNADNGKIIEINGLDESYITIKENVTLASPAQTKQRFFRINSVKLISQGNNATAITISNDGFTYAKINTVRGKNQAAIFTVPRGYNLYLYKVSCIASNNNGKFRKQISTNGETVYNTDQTNFANSFTIDSIPIKYPEKTDISFQIASNSDGTTIPCSVSAQGVLVKYL